MEIYVVKRQDTVDSIAESFQVPVEDIIYMNQLAYPYALAVGQALLIPVSGDTPSGSIVVNGYAYPFINPEILEGTLPFLTDVSVFSYGFTEDGNLTEPQLSVDWMLEKIQNADVNAILTLTPMDASGKFSNQLIHQMLRKEGASRNLINQLLQTVEEKGYYGVDVDFEYILAEDRDLFTTFVANMREQLNSKGYVVSVALAPKTSATQEGLLYEGKDYGGLGAAANSVLLMTYEWGYTYSEPRAVAPINKVREVIEYAITEIPVAKINMGIPNYGYDWPLPYEKGVTKATTIGNVQAVQIAIEHGAVILFDEVSQTPYFNYIENGVEHEVWFEDVRSLNAKFNLVEAYQLRGVGYWQIMRWFLANWLLLKDRFYIQ